MGYSGLIYAAIVAAWLAVLVPRWVRRNEDVERARETDAASGVRVLARRSGPIHAPHRTAAEGANSRTIISGHTGGLADSRREPTHHRQVSAPVRNNDAAVDGHRTRTPDDLALERLSDAFTTAARRRRRILTVLILAAVAVVAGTFIGGFPAWAPVVVGSGLVGFLLLARRAAVEQTQRRAALRRQMRRRAVEIVAPELDESPVLTTEDGKRVAVLDASEQAEPVRENTWEPVDVPLPTYVTKPKAPRVARTIDLSQPGSWTSGRFEPSRSYELPPRPPAVAETAEAPSAKAEAEAEAETEEFPEERRAVGE